MKILGRQYKIDRTGDLKQTTANMKRLAVLLLAVCLLSISVNGQNYYSHKYGKPSKIVRNIAKKEANNWLLNCGDTLHLPQKVKLGKLKFAAGGATIDLMDSLSRKGTIMSDLDKQNACKLIENSQLYIYVVKLKTKDRYYMESIVFYFNGHGNLEIIYISKNSTKYLSDPVYSNWCRPDCSVKK